MLSMQGYLGRVSDKSVHFFLLYNVLQILSKGNLNSNTIPRPPSPQHTHRRNESAPGEASGSFSLISHHMLSDSHTVTHTEPSQSRHAHPAAFCNPSPSEKRPCLSIGLQRAAQLAVGAEDSGPPLPSSACSMAFPRLAFRWAGLRRLSCLIELSVTGPRPRLNIVLEPRAMRPKTSEGNCFIIGDQGMVQTSAVEGSPGHCYLSPQHPTRTLNADTHVGLCHDALQVLGDTGPDCLLATSSQLA